MSRHLDQHLDQGQQRVWQEALDAVRETAANTDHESSSRQPLLRLVEQVRTEPEAVVREVALIRLEPMVHRMDPTDAEELLTSSWDGPHGVLGWHV